MIVKIFTLTNELEIIENVELIRIISGDYNLAIMRDYVPIIGAIDGSVTIVSDKTREFNNIKACYMCSKNFFNLIIEG